MTNSTCQILRQIAPGKPENQVESKSLDVTKVQSEVISTQQPMERILAECLTKKGHFDLTPFS